MSPCMVSENPWLLTTSGTAPLSYVGPADLLASRQSYNRLRAFDAPLKCRGLPRHPVPPTRRSGAYRDGTHTRKSDAARITHCKSDPIRTYHGSSVTLGVRRNRLQGSVREIRVQTLPIWGGSDTAL